MDSPKRTIRWVVDHRLCTGCGTCVAACPAGAIAMRETPAGLPRPAIDDGPCTHCGICYDVCSGVRYSMDLPRDVDGLFMPPTREVFLGRSTDPTMHTLGQSGGVATAMLTYMMRQNRISHALVTRMPKDGSLRPQAFFASRPEELLECMGSKYCLNPLNAALPGWPGGGAKVAMVGLGCHVHGIRNLQRLLPRRWADAFQLVIGLFCLQSSGYLGIDHLLRLRGEGKPVSRIIYRKKTAPGDRGHPCIEYSDGTFADLPEDFLWEFFNDKFAPLRCRFCFDQMNRSADLALGDTNGFPPEVSAKGLNVIAVYTQRGQDLLQQARRDGAIELFDCDRQVMWKGQVLLSDRKPRILSAYARWKQLGRPVPHVPVLEDLPARPQRLSTKVILRFLWKIEAVGDRSRAYRKLVRFVTLMKRLARFKSWLCTLRRGGGK